MVWKLRSPMPIAAGSRLATEAGKVAVKSGKEPLPPSGWGGVGRLGMEAVSMRSRARIPG